MSNSSGVNHPAKITVTEELYYIIKDINNSSNWVVIFENHCTRVQKATLAPGQISSHYHAYQEHGVAYYCTATWGGHEYQSYAYPSGTQACDDLYRKIVESIMNNELKKIPVHPSNATLPHNG